MLRHLTLTLLTLLALPAAHAAPTLTTVSTLSGATEDTALTISYETLAAAANEADAEGTALSFRVEAVSTGTLTKSGVAVVAGTTLLGTGESLVWTPAANANGTLNAFTIKAWDGTTTSATAIQVQVTVAAVNDAPALAAIAVSGTEDTTLAFTPANFTGAYTDPESTALASITVATLPATGLLKLSGTNVIASQVILAANLGNLTYVPAANENGAKTFKVTASDGTASSVAATVTMTLAAVNDAPSFALPVGTLGFDGATWTARESSRGWYAIASSADGTKLAAGVIGGQIYTSIDAGATWTARDSNRNWYAIASSADGTKLAAGVPGGKIYTSIDSGASWTPRLSDTNRDWWAIASSADGTKLAAGVYGGQIYTSTDSGATWTARESNRNWYSMASSADGTKLAAVVNGGQIYTSADSGATWTAAGISGYWWSIASSTDGLKLAAVSSGAKIYTSTAAFSPYVVTVAEDAGAQTQSGFATSVSAGPTDESAQTVSFTVTNTNNALFSAQPAINASGTLTFTPAANASGTGSLHPCAQ